MNAYVFATLVFVVVLCVLAVLAVFIDPPKRKREDDRT